MADHATEISDYEKQREERIADNRRVMRLLGLDQTDIDLADDDRAAPVRMPSGGSARKRKADMEPSALLLPSRRSRRLRTDSDSCGGADDAISVKSPVSTVDSWHAARQDEHIALRRQKGASVVGTASYQHTLMRCRTMSEAALRNRVKTIENAKGQHAVAKMRLFAQIAFLERYECIAALATAALERLIVELGDTDASTTEALPVE